MKPTPTHWSLAAAALASAHCFDPHAMPQYVNGLPRPLATASAVPAERVALHGPALTFAEFPLAVRGSGRPEYPDDFRVIVPAPPWNHVRGSRSLGTLRTADRVLDFPVYRALRCSLALVLPSSPWMTGTAWIGASPVSSASTGYGNIGPEYAPTPAQCPDVDPFTARLTVAPVIDDLLTEVRDRAAAVGADVVDELRCFAMSDLLRVWCEGVALRTPNAENLAVEDAPPPAWTLPPDRATPPAPQSTPPASGPEPTPPATTAAPATTTPPRASSSAQQVALRVIESSEGCPEKGALEAEITRRVGSSPFDDNAELQAELAMSRQGSSFRARLRFLRGTQLLAVRTLHVASRSCAALASSIALTLSLALGGWAPRGTP